MEPVLATMLPEDEYQGVHDATLEYETNTSDGYSHDYLQCQIPA